MDNKPMYWLKQVKYVESIYLDKEPTEQIPPPNMEPKQFSKGKLTFTGVPLSLLAPLVGKQLWWVQSSDGLERVITEHQLENWILTEQRELINLNTKAGSWIKNVLRFCGEKGISHCDYLLSIRKETQWENHGVPRAHRCASKKGTVGYEKRTHTTIKLDQHLQMAHQTLWSVVRDSENLQLITTKAPVNLPPVDFWW